MGTVNNEATISSSENRALAAACNRLVVVGGFRNHDFLPPLRRLVLPFLLAEESLRLDCTGDIKASISAES